MKKILFVLSFMSIVTFSMAQKFAYVDTDYILKSIPTYESAQDQLDIMSSDWQSEIESKYAEVEKLYKEFQAEKVLLTEEMKVKREEEIIQQEKEVKDLQKKYFGSEGSLFKKRKELIEPIQNDIFNAIKEIASEGNYAVIFDASGGANMLYSDPKYDKSDLILEKLGFKN
ncbi:MAG: OmpH family outer membrane protein [Salinivirgaceae bacterium]|nr:OmpH family outer membrane protein [Salinivirgaceae bacterium]